MAHLHTKLPVCANCYYAFPEGGPDDYCPRCGQQNHDINIGFGHVVEETLEGIFHFDGKVFRTAGLLLFHPGELTKRFLAGHRVPYVPPIRLYIFISFVFFFVLSLRFGHEEKKQEKALTAQQQRQRDQGLRQLDSLQKAGFVPPGVAARVPPRATAKPASKNEPGVGFTIGKTHLGPDEIKRLPAEPTNAQLDSVLRSKGEKSSFWGRLSVRRFIYWRDTTRAEKIHQGLRALSIALFLLLPLAALLLKGVYFRQHRNYVAHLIFTVHLHCFLFLLFLAVLLLGYAPFLEEYSAWLLWLIPVYFVVALHGFYQQSWGKTIGKSLLLGLTYTFTLLFAVVSALAMGFILF
ncbi:DUF3667 domain-containing protein [Hymenobacter jejuensis]|uniref:DUF3667 domain-containing protein n=1 Tax=Hymenobacter jejuensis TaxID=2502781 RepID=A0A5B7ZXI4_9BACT|nr:DUF3667 domain-containing protein [Hymenobacter jejuensis]QDA59854.1 DUF3667 domain-containing protein [Hymenobacter jejuensis]